MENEIKADLDKPEDIIDFSKITTKKKKKKKRPQADAPPATEEPVAAAAAAEETPATAAVETPTPAAPEAAEEKKGEDSDEPEIKADTDDGVTEGVIDFSKIKKKKKKKAPKTAGGDAAATEEASLPKAFDLNEVEGHTNYDYMFLLDRIDDIMKSKIKDQEEASEAKTTIQIITKTISTKTSWFNFAEICAALGRDQTHT